MNGIQPGPGKVAAIERLIPPKDVHEVRRFFGLTGFFHRFMPGFEQIAAHFTMLMRKDVVFMWEEAQKRAFEILREKLISKPVLGIYSLNASKTELHCDATKDGLGTILLQSDSSGKLKLVYAISRRTTEI